MNMKGIIELMNESPQQAVQLQEGQTLLDEIKDIIERQAQIDKRRIGYEWQVNGPIYNMLKEPRVILQKANK